MRKFEKISLSQWKEDFGDTEQYDKQKLPTRGTVKSAGYDFFSPVNAIIPAKGTALIPTGVKVCMEERDVLMIYPRSSMGFKTNIRLSNTSGVIDSDYYNNANNEGHIFIKFYNPGDKDFDINIGDKIAQGIFTEFKVVDDEEIIDVERAGGIGSTGK